MDGTSKSRQFNLTRWFVTLVILAMCAATYLHYFGLSLDDRYLFRNDSIAQMVPTPLADTSVSSAPGEILSYLGYDFEVPWPDVQKSGATVKGNVAIIPFRSGLTIAFLVHSSREFVDNLVRSGRMKREQFCKVYGSAACESDFVFKKMMFDVTPVQFGFFTPRRESEPKTYLLLMKEAALRKPSGIFLLEVKGRRGFQFGKPQATKDSIVDELYGENAGLEFIFGRRDKNPMSISQPEINRVLQTVERSSPR